MKRFFVFTFATLIVALMSLFSAPVLADDTDFGSVDVHDDPAQFISGSAWIGNFSYFSPNEDYASITCDHTVYAHHYVTDSEVSYTTTYKLEVDQNPVYRSEWGGSGTMDEYDEDDAMPQNYVSWSPFSHVNVTNLPRLADNRKYTATGYTRLDITNPDGDDLNLKAEDSWDFWHN
ncbi:hypothetical protein J4G08_20240 [Candidatus Poribacteria bacterium]|nr:hypothetical protein [Candidatus Poribacteria bacterium]